MSVELKPCPFCGGDEVTIGSFGSSCVEPLQDVKQIPGDIAHCFCSEGGDDFARRSLTCSVSRVDPKKKLSTAFASLNR